MAKATAQRPKRKHRKKPAAAAKTKTNAARKQQAAPAAKREELPQATEPSLLEQMQRYIGNNAVVSYLKSLLDDDHEKKEAKKPEVRASAVDTSAQQKAPAEAKSSGGGGEQELGVLSSRYESNGNPGLISTGKGDIGGRSYGAYQFNTADNIIDKFYFWLKSADSEVYSILEAGYKADGNKIGDKFDAAFKKLGADEPQRFLKLQHSFTKIVYYDQAVALIKSEFGLDIESRSFALKNVIWSRSVQHGPGSKQKGLLRLLIKTFKGQDVKSMNDEQIIRAIYKESGKLTSSAPSDKSKQIDGDDVKKSKNKSVKALADEVDGKYMAHFSGNGSEMQAGVYYRLNKAEPEQALKLLYGKDYKFNGL